jgi:hypothetical protein|tara:strand:- start:61 stop:351 length:291 start_codon:yes stop_codon:yes gene_type:complete
MEHSSETKEFHLPLEMQFAMRKAEVHAKDLDRDELICALLNLYHQRLMEWNALKALMAEEQVDIEFDIPTDLELSELVSYIPDDLIGEDDDENCFL